MPLGTPITISPSTHTVDPEWLDAGTNWIRLVDLIDVRTGVKRADATVACTLTSHDGTLSIGPVAMPAVSGSPGTYDTTILDSRFRVDSAVRLTITASTPDGALGTFNRTLLVVRG